MVEEHRSVARDEAHFGSERDTPTNMVGKLMVKGVLRGVVGHSPQTQELGLDVVLHSVRMIQEAVSENIITSSEADALTRFMIERLVDQKVELALKSILDFDDPLDFHFRGLKGMSR